MWWNFPFIVISLYVYDLPNVIKRTLEAQYICLFVSLFVRKFGPVRTYDTSGARRPPEVRVQYCRVLSGLVPLGQVL